MTVSGLDEPMKVYRLNNEIGQNTNFFVDLTNVMVVHIMNIKIGCFNQSVLREFNVYFLSWRKSIMGSVSKIFRRGGTILPQ